MRALFTPTSHNTPCADMYRARGVVPDGDGWVFPGGPVLAARPTWFSPAVKTGAVTADGVAE
ncbi:MAG: hypothetical protein AB1730_00055 [Myxococcota bacterium]|jgi:hypothetical protein